MKGEEYKCRLCFSEAIIAPDKENEIWIIDGPEKVLPGFLPARLVNTE